MCCATVAYGGFTIHLIKTIVRSAERKEASMAKYLIQSLVLEGERPMSWNQLYKQGHWGARKQEADRVHQLVSLEARGMRMAEGVVSIEVMAFFDKYPLDADNICAKMYIDGLIGTVIENDSYKFVSSVMTETLIDREDPRVVIHISEKVEE